MGAVSSAPELWCKWLHPAETAFSYREPFWFSPLTLPGVWNLHLCLCETGVLFPSAKFHISAEEQEISLICSQELWTIAVLLIMFFIKCPSSVQAGGWDEWKVCACCSCCPLWNRITQLFSCAGKKKKLFSALFIPWINFLSHSWFIS